MKKSIITLGILALTIMNVNATEVNTNFTKKSSISENVITRDQIKEIYDWSVKTNNGSYSGTATSITEAQKMIALSTVGEIILSKQIECFYQLENEVYSQNARLFFWEVATSMGKEKGFSSSESQAKKMIELVSTGEVVSFKIIETGDFKQ